MGAKNELKKFYESQTNVSASLRKDHENVQKDSLAYIPSIEIAELCKVAENSYRFVEIAFAEEIKMICEELGVNFESAREAINTKWNIKLLEAPNGIGGHCLPKDIRYLRSISKQNTIIKAAISVDQQYKEKTHETEKRV